MLAEPVLDSERKIRSSALALLWTVPKIWQNISIAIFLELAQMEPQNLQKETGEQGGLRLVADTKVRTASAVTYKRSYVTGMPVYTCRRRTLMECMDALG